MTSADKDKPIRIMYLHGYGSRFDPHSDKMQVLSRLGEVFGPDLDYGQGLFSRPGWFFQIRFRAHITSNLPL